MTFNIVLSIIVITGIIFYLQRKIWMQCPLVVFPAFILILYYWSLAGAWFFCFDQITGLGKLLGMQYHYLLIKMFPVNLDIDYLLSLWIMGVFIIVLQLLILFVVRLIPLHQIKVQFQYSGIDFFYTTAALFFLTVSIILVQDVITYSLILNESVYLNIRSSGIPYYSIHQLACWAMMLCLSIPLALSLLNRIRNIGNVNLGVYYWFVFILCNVYLVFIGSRHEAFLCGFIILLILGLSYKSFLQHKKILLLIVVIWITILALNDPFRSLTPLVSKRLGLTDLISTPHNLEQAEWYRVDRSFIQHHNSQISKEILSEELNSDTILVNNGDTLQIKKYDLMEYWRQGKYSVVINNNSVILSNPHTSEVYHHLGFMEKMLKALTGVLYSNEMFTGHFSLYGVLHHQIPVKTAISFKYLFNSFVPKFIEQDRPASSYEYYASSLGLPSTQGFTINHITAWYLNFSFYGLLLGPIALAIFLFAPLFLVYYSKSDIYKTAAICVTGCIVAFAAMIVRSGPEAYKTWIYEGIIMPYILFISGIYFHRLLQLLKIKVFIKKQ